MYILFKVNIPVSIIENKALLPQAYVTLADIGYPV